MTAIKSTLVFAFTMMNVSFSFMSSPALTALTATPRYTHALAQAHPCPSNYIHNTYNKQLHGFLLL